jgi:hypothetical protein
MASLISLRENQAVTLRKLTIKLLTVLLISYLIN